MDNQHTKIIGYRSLTQVEIDLMNKIKAHAEATKALMLEVREHVTTCFRINAAEWKPPVENTPFVAGEQRAETPEVIAAKDAEIERLNASECYRWTSIASTDFQTGFMALTRAVAQPTTY